MEGTPDLAFYRDVIDHSQDGQGYYDAAESAMGGFSTQNYSLFNWRLPTYALLFRHVPVAWFVLLLVVALVSVVVAVRTLVMPLTGSTGQLTATLLLLGGTFGWVVYENDAFLATEPWCEVLLLLSLCAYAHGRWQWGMLAAVAGLSLRELMLPYCAVAFLFAVWKRRRTEWLLWLVVFFSFFAGLYLHGQEIARRHPEIEGTGIGHWLRWPGLRYVLLSSSMNLVIRPLPTEVWALVLPLALLGLGGWPGEIGLRLFASAIAYVLAFSIMEARSYWGHLYAPLLALGLLRAPAALRDLLRPAAKVGYIARS